MGFRIAERIVLMLPCRTMEVTRGLMTFTSAGAVLLVSWREGPSNFPGGAGDFEYTPEHAYSYPQLLDRKGKYLYIYGYAFRRFTMSILQSERTIAAAGCDFINNLYDVLIELLRLAETYRQISSARKTDESFSLVDIWPPHAGAAPCANPRTTVGRLKAVSICKPSQIMLTSPLSLMFHSLGMHRAPLCLSNEIYDAIFCCSPGR
jgi:hypothetical protein